MRPHRPWDKRSSNFKERPVRCSVAPSGGIASLHVTLVERVKLLLRKQETGKNKMDRFNKKTKNGLQFGAMFFKGRSWGGTQVVCNIITQLMSNVHMTWLHIWFEAVGFRHPESWFLNLLLGPWTQLINLVMLWFHSCLFSLLMIGCVLPKGQVSQTPDVV